MVAELKLFNGNPSVLCFFLFYVTFKDLFSFLHFFISHLVQEMYAVEVRQNPH